MITHSTRGFDADVVLIGGGIMSATLGAMLAQERPDWRILLLERADEPATESSGPWNNAGTGHTGFCELNYMPDPADAALPLSMVEQFGRTRAWWDGLVAAGDLDGGFLHTVPHLDVVFGERDMTYLRQRFETLRPHPAFAAMEYTENPETIRQWAPLVMEGRGPESMWGRMAATRHPGGTDVDFGALTRGLLSIVTRAGGEVRYGHEVTRLRRTLAGWTVRGRGPQGRFELRARRVFVGAGGNALRLLQSARLPEVRGYAVLPVGAAFLRCSDPEVARRHDGKVYGQAAIGAPPMSVPHLDRRYVDGADHLLFGPYATFSTKLLKRGRLTDFFRTLRPGNLHVITAAGLQNLSLVRYLVGQLAASRRARFAQLQRFYPDADPAQWELVSAGQRAQLVTPDRRRIGVLQQGTELVTGADGTIAGLLGASPGASTAVPIMQDLLDRWGITGDVESQANREKSPAAS
ncbi:MULTISPECIES: malate:quinone oxidoreductase [Tsukamurella]|uniref:Probable malate:quinone oxidoreductase n=2 Tax=Tsukamurella TaxID=2060 RepID=A0A5C5RY26_9ACTN|nr:MULTISPECIES: malate:quinone oxidoreductase [Tsukamurella]NMD58089.1 malate:quinone oxidoreductase [Tsukamurella columbiensis]TWS28007.1 malate:quinone oxidoreductase [Tsukamurella conjunctivitidis]